VKTKQRCCIDLVCFLQVKELAEEKDELASKVEALEEDLTNEREKLELEQTESKETIVQLEERVAEKENAAQLAENNVEQLQVCSSCLFF
jgi:hypothetical protein